MYAQLGNIRFEGLKGFSSLEETFGVNYAQHDLIKGKPRLERVGDSLDAISMEIALHSSFTDPESDIFALKNFLTDGEILPFILGTGFIVGNFVITNISKTTNFTDASGNLISASLKLDLLESFNSDQLKESQKRARDKAFATNTKNSNTRTVLPVKRSPASTLCVDIQAMDLQSKLLTQNTASVEMNPATSKHYSKKIGFNLSSIESSISDIQKQLTNAQELQNLATSMPEALQSVYTAVQNMKAVLPISDISSFKTLNRNLSISILNVKNANVNINNQSIIRRK